MTGTSYTGTVYIHSTPYQLWTALTTPDRIRLYFDFVQGWMAVESSWMPGSPVAYRTSDGQVQIEGTVLEVEPPTRLMTSLALLYDPQVRQDRPSRLSWVVEQMGEVCKLSVTHDDTDGETQTARDVATCMPAILSNLKILLESGRPRLIKEIVVDCEAPEIVAAFWAAVTGYDQVVATDSYVAIADPHGVEPEIAFVKVPEPKTVKNRIHLDLHVSDLAAEVERLLSLGARRADGFPQKETLAVMSDPEGNEFCVFG